MIDVSGIEYDFLPSVLWVIVPVGILFAVTALDEVFGWGDVGFVTLGVGLLYLIFGSFLVIGLQSATAVGQEESRITTDQLSDQGFSRVVLDWGGKSFTASLDGQYFEGVLHPVGDYKYQVLEVGEVKP